MGRYAVYRTDGDGETKLIAETITLGEAAMACGAKNYKEMEELWYEPIWLYGQYRVEEDPAHMNCGDPDDYSWVDDAINYDKGALRVLRDLECALSAPEMTIARAEDILKVIKKQRENYETDLEFMYK